MAKLLLASGSPYRRALLARLGLSFGCDSPDIDETPHRGESAEDLVARLSREKVLTLAKAYPKQVIVGSDQAADLNGSILGKPGTAQRALAQLKACSGRTVTFYTGVCVYCGESGRAEAAVVPTEVRFLKLERQKLETYLALEQPYDCAGSFKSEGLGITLFDAIESADPTALVGLPLIALTRLLRNVGIEPLEG